MVSVENNNKKNWKNEEEVEEVNEKKKRVFSQIFVVDDPIQVDELMFTFLFVCEWDGWWLMMPKKMRLILTHVNWSFISVKHRELNFN